MITLTQFSQAGTGRVRAAWLRWQSRVSGLYYRRVTEPVQLWLALGRPAEFTPQLPWWQPFVWRYLSITGWSRHFPRSRHRRVLPCASLHSHATKQTGGRYADSPPIRTCLCNCPLALLTASFILSSAHAMKPQFEYKCVRLAEGRP